MNDEGELVVWCGNIQVYGIKLHRASISTKYWSVTAMDYFYNQMELNDPNLNHPARMIEGMTDSPYQHTFMCYYRINPYDFQPFI